MSDVFHLGLKKTDLDGATLAIVPGREHQKECRLLPSFWIDLNF